MKQAKLGEDFYRQANRIVLEALRRNIIVFPPMLSDRKESKVKKTAGICSKCGQNYTKNVPIQKYCFDCGELEAKERNFKRRHGITKKYNSPSV